MFKIRKELQAFGKNAYSVDKRKTILDIQTLPEILNSSNNKISSTRTPENQWATLTISFMCRSQHSDVWCMKPTDTNPMLWGECNSCLIVPRINIYMIRSKHLTNWEANMLWFFSNVKKVFSTQGLRVIVTTDTGYCGQALNLASSLGMYQQDFTVFPTASKTQQWLAAHFPDHTTPDI